MSLRTSEKLAKPDIIEKVSKPTYSTMTFSEVQEMNIELPKKVIGDLLYLNELTVLFAYNGRGKSIFAFQVAICVATGNDLDLSNGITLINECDPINVIYFDYEMKEVQIKDRLGSKQLPKNLYRSSLHRGASEGKNPKEIFERIKKEAESKEAKFIIIDNMSKISSMDLTKGNEVKSFLEPLHQLSLYDGYTILLIGHTTFSADAFIPLEKKHLYGSSYISNYMDAMIGIGMTNSDEKQYYIKQLKTRINAEIYGSNNVIRVRIDKDHDNFTRYFGLKTCNESELLNPISVNTEKAPNRTFYTYASLYYGSVDKAIPYIEEAGFEVTRRTIFNNRNAFKNADSKSYNAFKGYDADAQKEMLESQNPNSDKCLPLRSGHVADDNNEIAF